MKLLPVLIFLQLIFGIVLLSLSNNDKRVLGLSFHLAQIAPEVTPELLPTLPETPTPAETPTGATPETPTPATSEPTTPEPNAIIPVKPTPFLENTTQMILEPSNTINSTEDISQTAIDKAVEEDTKLEAVVDPEAKNELIIEIASNQVKDMDRLIDGNDHTSVNFIAQRLNNEIETAVNNLNNLPNDKKGNAQQRLTNFCNNSDLGLRVVELSVSEETQQDIEIIRGLCQGI